MPDWQQSWMNCPALVEPSVSSGPLLRDQSAGVAVDRGVTAHRVRSVERLPLEEVRVVDQSRDHLARVVGHAVVGRHDAEDLFGIVSRRRRVARDAASRAAPAPNRSFGDHLARQLERVRVVLGQVLGDAGDRRRAARRRRATRRRRPGRAPPSPAAGRRGRSWRGRAPRSRSRRAPGCRRRRRSTIRAPPTSPGCRPPTAAPGWRRCDRPSTKISAW